MASEVDVAAINPTERARYEKKREREFYAYYEPIRLLSGGSAEKFTDLNSPEAVAAHQACSSPDKTLTAFCQLAAVRLGMKRAMLFFFDSDNAYILAEATRTLSLRRDSLHDDGDDLWLGRTVIPRGHSVCEETALLGMASTLHVIKNLADDARFCDRAYVKGGPNARFYAGVPITTPKGINIGAFCVLDDQSHDGLGEKDTIFMQEMSVTIMDHLEMIRTKAEHRRLSNMTTGLANFVRETGSNPHIKATVLTGARSEKSGLSRPKTILRTGSSNTGSIATLSKAQSLPVHRDQNPNSTLPSEATLSQAAPTAQPISLPGDSPTSTEMRRRSGSSTGESKDDPEFSFRDRTIRETMGRAAAFIRTALDADGVLFPDASLLGFGRHTDSSTEKDAASDTEQTGSDTERSSLADDPIADNDACLTLGISVAPSAESDTPSSPVIPHRLLQTVLKYHGKGKIWNFSADDGDYSDSASAAATDTALSTGTETGSAETIGVPKRASKRSALRKTLSTLFPKVRSLMLLGLWDPVRAKWASCCIVFSLSPTRVFSAEDDLNYVQVWNDIITAQLGRLDVELASKAKSDFISSISHELRSPLHGILGTVEILKESISDPEISSMVNAIEVSGRTLSDIVESLLGYSKINSTAQLKGRSRTNVLSGKKSGIHLDADIELDKLTEEVIESAVYSFSFRAKAGHRVTTILDIDRSIGVSWRCRIAIGAWKRVCINLTQNALKYTKEGYILVSLKMLPANSGRRRGSALLTIADSGKGMSREFLEHQLFRAFTQEDDLTEGTGLGMSMVAKIIKGLGGEIKVQSEKDRGTVVRVTVPLEVSSYDRKLAAEESQRTHTASLLPSVLVDFLGNPIQEGSGTMNNAHKLQSATIRKTCEESLNLSLPSPSWQVSSEATLAMILEADASQLLRLLQSEPTDEVEIAALDLIKSRPIVVICKDYSSARRLKASPVVQLLHGQVEYVSQPCGPERLGSAFRHCLDSLHQNTRPDTSLAHSDSSDSLPSEALLGQDNEDTVVEMPLPHLTIAEAVLDANRHQDTEPVHDSLSWTSPSRSATIEATEVSLHDTKANGTSPLPATSKLPRSTNKQQRLPLLLVDDNAINLQLLTAYAKKNGHKFALAHDGLEAFEAYKAGTHADAADFDRADIAAASTPYSSGARLVKPAVILLDLSMPIMSGFESARHIRSFERKYNIPPVTIIALTGLGSADALREAYQSGINLYLTKPVRLKELTKLLKEIQEGVAPKVKGQS